jgi:homoserine O-acetyltransferase/O-succinyltransferase
MDHEIFELPGFTTQAGATLDLKFAYKTRGRLSPRRDNAIVVLTSYAAQHDEAEGLLAGLDLSNYYIVLINMLSNGLSSSPSNTPPPFDGARFPGMTIHDNVACQHRLIEALGVERLRLVTGFSMGALQTFEWGCQHAEMVNAILPICGAARVSPHNYLFLDGVKAALVADKSFSGRDYTEPPINGLRAFGRVYAGWVFSQTFFRNQAHKTMGLDSIEDVVGFMQGYFMRRDANDLLGMLWTWQHADISANDRFKGDLRAALASISARAIVMPCNTDLYFTVADSVLEVNTMPNAELRPIDSILGHVAGSGMDPIGKAAIDRTILELLAQ